MADVKNNILDNHAMLDGLEPIEAYRIGLLVVAMNLGMVVTFDYDGKDRMVEVHAIGTSTKDGGIVVRAVQIGGESSRKVPCWALFRVDGMSKVGYLTVLRSRAPREGYSMGDKQMEKILCEIQL